MEQEPNQQVMPSREQMIADLVASRSERSPASIPQEAPQENAMPSREQMISDLIARSFKPEPSLDEQVQQISQKQKQKVEQRQPLKAPEPVPQAPKPAAQEPTVKAPMKLPALSNLVLDKQKKFNIPDEIISGAFQTDHELGLRKGSTLGQLLAESQLDPEAKSRVGASGIAQIMPKTLASLEKRFKRKLDPKNFSDAIIMNREVMKENLKKFNTWEKALLAYNAGWDPKEWGKTKENREYINRVKLWRSKVFAPKARGVVS